MFMKTLWAGQIVLGRCTAPPAGGAAISTYWRILWLWRNSVVCNLLLLPNLAKTTALSSHGDSYGKGWRGDIFVCESTCLKTQSATYSPSSPVEVLGMSLSTMFLNLLSPGRGIRKEQSLSHGFWGWSSWNLRGQKRTLSRSQPRCFRDLPSF